MVTAPSTAPVDHAETLCAYPASTNKGSTGAMLARLYRDESGATAIEYGLIIALIAIAMVVALQGAGNSLSATMTKATTGMAG